MQSVTADGAVRKRVTRAGRLGDVDKDGSEPSPPVGPKAKVTIKYSMSLPGVPEPFDSSSNRRGGTLKFTLGKGKSLRGLEALAASMCVGEYCEGEIDSSWAYGEKGLERCGVPPGSTIEVEMEMVDAELEKKGKGLMEMSSQERFAEASACKERGNEYFRDGQIEKASAEYTRCFRFIEYIFYRPKAAESETSDVTGAAEENGTEDDKSGGSKTEDSGDAGDKPQGDGAVGNEEGHEEGHETDEEVEEIDVSGDASPETDESGFVEAATEEDGKDSQEILTDDSPDEPSEQDVRELHIVTLNNMALCLLKLGENKKAVEYASLSAAMDHSSHKPLFYRARARSALGDWDEAKEDLLAAAKLAPKNMGIRIELDKLNKKMRAHKANERKAAAAMFG